MRRSVASIPFAAALRSGPSLRGRLHPRNVDSGAGREVFDDLGEPATLHFHHEAEHVAALLAAEAVVKLPLSIYVE